MVAGRVLVRPGSLTHGPELPLSSFAGWLVLGLLCLVLLPSPAAAEPPRSFELVTPADPVAGRVIGVLQIDADGTHLLYSSVGPMPGAAGGNFIATNEAMRGESGWVTRPIGFPFSISEFTFEGRLTAEPQAFSPDFSSSIWVGLIPLTPNAPATGAALYRLEPGTGLTALAKVRGAGAFVGASEDTQHVIFSSEEHLLPEDGARTEGSSIYEVDGLALRLVDVDSGGVPVSACGSVASGAGAVSRSGDRVFFTSPPAFSSCGDPSEVYMREGGTATVWVSESQCSRIDCNAPASVHFAGATPDGSTVFMTTTQQLVDADVDEKRDLYAYDVSSGAMRLVSQSAPGETGQVLDIPVKVAGEGSAVYFFAEGRLLPGLGRESGSNLYRGDEDGIHFVAPLEPLSPLQVSRSGQVAVFSTADSLEAADSDSVRDVYRYDATDESVQRISSGPGGGNGSFAADITSPIEHFFFTPVERSLSEDGRHVFFSTAESLLPEDGNDVSDVYGWSSEGLELISPGDAETPAAFAFASADGSTVAFATQQTILPVDRDGGENDLYVARVGGGFPVDAEPAECSGEACLGPAPPRLERGGLASEAVSPERTRRPRVVQVSSRAGSEIVERGYTDVAVRVFGPGAVVARASPPGGGTKAGPALRGVAGAVKAGTVALRLRAAGWARQELRRDHVLRLRLALRQADARATGNLVIRWGGVR